MRRRLVPYATKKSAAGTRASHGHWIRIAIWGKSARQRRRASDRRHLTRARHDGVPAFRHQLAEEFLPARQLLEPRVNGFHRLLDAIDARFFRTFRPEQAILEPAYSPRRPESA